MQEGARLAKQLDKERAESEAAGDKASARATEAAAKLEALLGQTRVGAAL